MLLEGVIRHLPRGYFRVILCPIASPGKSLAPDLAQAADDVQQLPLKQGLARAILQGLRLGQAHSRTIHITLRVAGIFISTQIFFACACTSTA